MRHVYIRSILALVWLAAAIICGISGKFEISLFYVLLSGIFLLSAYASWKQEKDNKGDKKHE